MCNTCFVNSQASFSFTFCFFDLVTLVWQTSIWSSFRSMLSSSTFCSIRLKFIWALCSFRLSLNNCWPSNVSSTGGIFLSSLLTLRSVFFWLKASGVRCVANSSAAVFLAFIGCPWIWLQKNLVAEEICSRWVSPKIEPYSLSNLVRAQHIAVARYNRDRVRIMVIFVTLIVARIWLVSASKEWSTSSTVFC